MSDNVRMRVAVLADIHGNVPALEAVLDDARRIGVEAFAVAGDFTGGPWSQQTVDRVLALTDLVIAGNHEGYYTTYDRGEAPAGWYESDQWAAMRWSYHRLSRAGLAAIAALPHQLVLTFDDAAAGPAPDPVRVLHGTPESATRHLYPDRSPEALAAFRRAGLLRDGVEPPKLAAAVADVAEPVLVCGHSHISWIQREPRHLVVNPGSVGGPINGDPRAQYAVLTWSEGRWQAEIRYVAYDVARVREAFERSGYLEEGGPVARAILRGVETGLNVVGALLRHVDGLAAERGIRGVAFLPNDVWDDAVASFDWHGGTS